VIFSLVDSRALRNFYVHADVACAEVVPLLVSDRGKFLTGANYRVEGGMTAR
jgi:hypothetical protein